ncbi:berberine bridge enzyme-like Cyn d 4 [Phragmites australis]|uniref:berberine bridge enzyme-like Cyn d 4 n=1 Tax=Phragmites australis TaxID=29695 RepID=UPI002D7766CF|nr:berberine bridge enzyme-like Cyn d 4 [Phragmites australis]
MAMARSVALVLLAAFVAIVHHAASVAHAAAAAAPATDAAGFLHCLAVHLPPGIVYLHASQSYTSILESSIRNLLFVTPTTPTPLAIVAATNASHVQAAVRCGARHDVRVRPRSGGHDYEGLSYRTLGAACPFAVVDLAALRAIRVDVRREIAWVGSGATLGELYYAIAKQSARLGFPGGVCPTVGIGGHLSGGGFGLMLRKHGLAADHVIDAVIVDAKGRLLDRVAMGEDLFWAIRGSGGGSFGIVLSWKLLLVRVPTTVTVFTIHRPRNQSATALLTKWQRVAPALPRDVILRVVLQNLDAQFESLYLGTCSGLVATMAERFPELGVKRKDCIEMTWIQSALYFAFYGTGKPMELLLDRGTKPDRYFKAKSDYVSEPIPSHVWESTWSWFLRDGAGLLILDPYGGRMGSVAPSATPFPHRQELYNLQYYGFWFENGTEASEKHMGWIRGLHREMEPYVSKNPRGAYVNYRDLDLGVNGDDEDHGGVSSYEKARTWGHTYFKANFERLAAVKAMVDPDDFFRNEQSIPPLPSSRNGSSHS